MINVHFSRFIEELIDTKKLENIAKYYSTRHKQGTKSLIKNKFVNLFYKVFLEHMCIYIFGDVMRCMAYHFF